MEELVVLPKTIARGLLYHFVAGCYTYPSREFHRALHQSELWRQLRTVGKTLGQPVHQAITNLQDGIGMGHEEERLPLLDIEIEYTYLFINAISHLPAPPYESAYGSEGLLMGRAASQVLRAYRDAGLAMCEDYGLLPDHLTTELEFMAYLVEQEAVTLRVASSQAEAWQARQQRFLAEHLLRWSPVFLARVAKYARRPFYLRIADLTAALFRSEEQQLGLSASKARRNA